MASNPNQKGDHLAPHLALKFAYDGKCFSGFQRQPDKRTIEGDIRSSLTRLQKSIQAKSSLDPTSRTNENEPDPVIQRSNPFGYSYSSRTDAGVSAVGNVLTLHSPLEGPGIIKYLNHELEDILFHGYAEIPEDFNPRHANERWYRYLLPTHINEHGHLCVFSSGRSVTFNLQVARYALASFHGEHDFTSFSKCEAHKNPNRRINSTSVGIKEIIIGFPPVVIIDVRGESFLWMMVRNMIGAMMAVLSEAWTLDRIHEMLQFPGTLPKPVPAPSTPLLLMDVSFTTIKFFSLSVNFDQMNFINKGLNFLPMIEIIRHLSGSATD